MPERGERHADLNGSLRGATWRTCAASAAAALVSVRDHSAMQPSLSLLLRRARPVPGPLPQHGTVVSGARRHRARGRSVAYADRWRDFFAARFCRDLRVRAFEGFARHAVNERVAELLSARPPFSVEVSIYGADAEHYERTTQIPGSFARFEQGVARLQGAGVPLLMKCPISTLSANHVAALVRWCTDRSLPFKADPVIDARHDGGQQPALYRIEPRNVVALRDELHQLRHGQPRPAGPLPECSARADGDGPEELYTCGAGRIAFFVDALGQASHCVIDREPSFPILDLPWETVWSEIGRWVTQPLPSEA